MPTIHRQLLDWCRRRNLDGCEGFATELDDALLKESALSAEVLLSACRGLRTSFFRTNRLDREEIASELAESLELPAVRSHLMKLDPPKDRRHKRSSNPDPDLFLSYYHVDLPFVQGVSTDVADAGFSVWYDRNGITAGANFPREIERALEITTYIGVVVTPASIERPWVKKEIDVGHVREGAEDREILVPLLLEDASLPLLMRPKQRCDFRIDYESGLSELLGCLSA